MGEAILEKYLRARFHSFFPNGAAYKFISPNRRFVPDQILDTGRVLAYIEVKANEKAKIHPGQIREILRIRRRGRIADVVWNTTQVTELLNILGQVHDLRYDPSFLRSDSSLFTSFGKYNFHPGETEDP